MQHARIRTKYLTRTTHREKMSTLRSQRYTLQAICGHAFRANFVNRHMDSRCWPDKPEHVLLFGESLVKFLRGALREMIWTEMVMGPGGHRVRGHHADQLVMRRDTTLKRDIRQSGGRVNVRPEPSSINTATH